VRGMLGMNLGPKKPSSHRTSNIMMIQVSMRFLLLSYLSGAAIVDGNIWDAHRSHDAELTDQYVYAGHNLSYNKGSPVTSIARGVLISASWGRPRHSQDRYI
jgi:hypothetical protein